jgi:hypothetical protein
MSSCLYDPKITTDSDDNLEPSSGYEKIVSYYFVVCMGVQDTRAGRAKARKNQVLLGKNKKQLLGKKQARRSNC